MTTTTASRTKKPSQLVKWRCRQCDTVIKLPMGTLPNVCDCGTLPCWERIREQPRRIQGK